MWEPEQSARAIPILPSLDIARTRAFYEERLGFAGQHYEEENYLILRRGEIDADSPFYHRMDGNGAPWEA
jgi:catechol 2,3-dioxygenase-like lactoylglutathione lyase family enzyme